MEEERFHPWITGTEHLGGTVVRFHFAGSVVRDVDLRAVLSSEDMAGLEAEPSCVGQVRTTVMWPNGLHVPPEMLDLIYAGFGERRGWPTTAPSLDPEAPFPFPPLRDTGVWTIGRGPDPAAQTLASSAASWRRRKIDAVMETLRKDVDRLMLWWAEARDKLAELVDAEDRRKVLRSGLADVGMTSMALRSLEEFLRDAGWGDALATADPAVIDYITEATRWNEVWVVREAIAAAEIIDPLENPRGFCEELRARLSLSEPDAQPGAETAGSD